MKDRRLSLEDDGRITLRLLDLDAADALSEEYGIPHEDGFFDLGHVDDMEITRHHGLDAEFRRDWIALGRVWDADQADRRRPVAYTVPSYTGDVR